MVGLVFNPINLHTSIVVFCVGHLVCRNYQSDCCVEQFDKAYKWTRISFEVPFVRHTRLMCFKESSSMQPLVGRNASYHHFSLLHYSRASDTRSPLSSPPPALLCLCYALQPKPRGDIGVALRCCASLCGIARNTFRLALHMHADARKKARGAG